MPQDDKKKRYLDWKKVEDLSYNSVHLSGNAYDAKYKIIKGERKGFGRSCTKCKKEKEDKDKKDKKQKGFKVDPTKYDKIVYTPLYVGCERATVSTPPDIGSFLEKRHAENIQYKYTHPDYNPSNVNDPSFDQITYPVDPIYSGFQGIVVENTCIPEYTKYSNMALSAKNKARKVAQDQIAVGVYNENSYLVIYESVSTGTEYQETYEIISYFLTLVASGIRSGKQEEYLSSFPLPYNSIRSEAEKLSKLLQAENPSLETREDIENFISYIKNRVFALYIQEDIGLKTVASEHGIIDAIGDFTPSKETTKFSPSILDVLNGTDATFQAYLDLYYIPDPRKQDGSTARNKTSVPVIGAKDNLVINIPNEPFTR